MDSQFIRRPNSAIIVLSNLMDVHGNLNGESAGRMSLAVERYMKSDAQFILTCGWDYRDDTNITVADAMRNFALENYCVPPTAILTDKTSRDTVGDAVFSKSNFALRLGWQDIVVVTSDYHVKRTKIVFSFVFGPNYNLEVIGSTYLASESPQGTEEKSIQAFSETFKKIAPGNDFQIQERLAKAHPYYNGDIYPKIC